MCILNKVKKQWVFYDKTADAYYLKLAKEKVNSRGSADGVSIAKEVGQLILFFEQNVRQYLIPAKESIKSM